MSKNSGNSKKSLKNAAQLLKCRVLAFVAHSKIREFHTIGAKDDMKIFILRIGSLISQRSAQKA